MLKLSSLSNENPSADLVDQMNINQRITVHKYDHEYALERFEDQFVLTVHKKNQRTGKEELVRLCKFDRDFQIIESVGEIKSGTPEQSLFRTLITVMQGNFDLSILKRMPRNSHLSTIRDDRQIALKKTCGVKKTDNPQIEICLGLEQGGEEIGDGIMAIVTEDLYLLGATTHQKVDDCMKVVSRWGESDIHGLELMLSIYSAMDSIKDVERNQIEALPDVTAKVKKVQERANKQVQKIARIELKKMPASHSRIR